MRLNTISIDAEHTHNGPILSEAILKKTLKLTDSIMIFRNIIMFHTLQCQNPILLHKF